MSVLIVGAGPVGLATAGELLRRGVPVRVVDRATSAGIASKAIIVWPRTLEILSGLGVAEPMAQTGHRLAGVAFHSRGRPIGQVWVSRLPDSRFNHVLMLPQQQTERILRDRFAELGGVVERGVELVELHNRPAGVDAVLRHPDGTREEVTAAWVVGADGAHSTVRKLTGIAFDILAPNMTFAIADAPIDGRIDESLLHYHYSPHGALGVGPLGGGLFRFAVSLGPHAVAGRELFQAALDQRAGPIGRVGTPKWQATFEVRVATAATFRSGRVFLAGDAAHVLSPAGGQGLNTGFQDAVNLAWKLAGVLTGRLRPAVLDTYSTERRDAVRRVSQTTAWQTRWGLLRSPGKALVRDSLIRAAAGTGLLQHVLAPLFSQTDLRYGRYDSPWRPRSWRYPAVRAGGRLPYRPDLNSSAAPVLVVSGGRLGDADRKLLCERLLAAAPAPIELIDLGELLGEPAGRLARLLGPEPTALVVRPDGHLVTVAPADRPERVFAGLGELLAPGRTTPLEVE